ncbi:hypothetical protein TcWFU_009814 [Taenia crassiceps]|uniref:Uncharacterized protein n=1 Tax=Taenia crassiceps TaxID=6207 RepID=A0ABR4Q2T9_9CEST
MKLQQVYYHQMTTVSLAEFQISSVRPDSFPNWIVLTFDEAHLLECYYCHSPYCSKIFKLTVTEGDDADLDEYLTTTDLDQTAKDSLLFVSLRRVREPSTAKHMVWWTGARRKSLRALRVLQANSTACTRCNGMVDEVLTSAHPVPIPVLVTL